MKNPESLTHNILSPRNKGLQFKRHTMNWLRMSTFAFLLLTFAFAQAQTSSIDGNQYAFEYSGSNSNVAKTGFGLYFNQNNPSPTRYEFLDNNGTEMFTIGATSGHLWANGSIQCSGNINPGGALQVDGNQYAFQYSGNPNYGMYFNSNVAAYELLDGSSNKVFSVNGNTGNVYMKGNIGINTESMIGSANFVLKSPGNSGYGGMYVEVDGATGLPFYGYATATDNMWHYFEEATEKWILYNDGIRLVVDNTGEVGIGTSAPLSELSVGGAGSGNYTGYFESSATSSSTHVLHANANGSATGNLTAVYGSATTNGYGYGGQFHGGYMGLYATSTVFASPTGYKYGLNAAAGGFSSSYALGVRAVAQGHDGVNYGVYGTWSSSGSATNYAGYFNGNLHYNGNLTGPSDARLKQNVQPVRNALELVNQLNAKTYEFKTEEYDFMHLPKGGQFGFIAQELEQVLPELVQQAIHPASDPLLEEENQHDEVAFKSVNYLSLIPVLAEAIKEQSAIFDEKEAAITTLQNDLEELKNQVQQMAAHLDDDADVKTENQTSSKKSTRWNESEDGKAKLHSNFPNPFSGETKIGYEIPSGTQHAKLILSDRAGRIVKSVRLTDNQQFITINASELLDVVHFYSLEIDGNIVATKRMMAIK